MSGWSPSLLHTVLVQPMIASCCESLFKGFRFVGDSTNDRRVLVSNCLAVNAMEVDESLLMAETEMVSLPFFASTCSRYSVAVMPFRSVVRWWHATLCRFALSYASFLPLGVAKLEWAWCWSPNMMDGLLLNNCKDSAALSIRFGRTVLRSWGRRVLD